MKAIVKILSLAVLILTVKSWVLPTEKCHMDDSKCLVSAYQKMVPIFFNGIPEVGVEKIEKLGDVQFDLSGLVFTLKNGRIKGLKDAVMDKAQWDLDKKVIKLKFHFDCILQGDYTATGKILILPIDGDGKLDLKLKNLFVTLECNFDMMKKKDGKTYVRVKDYAFEYEVKDNAVYKMTNLFKGNKELSDHLQTFINDNWKDVTNEFGKPLLDNVAKLVLKNSNMFFKNLAMEDIAIT